MSRLVPWIQRPNRGRMPSYGEEVWKDEKKTAENCPYCKGIMSKARREFSLDLGCWIRYRYCLRCGVRHWQEPERVKENLI